MENKNLILDLVSKIKKPSQWRGVKTNSPYYRKALAVRFIKPILDEIVKNQNIEAVFYTHKMGNIKLSTLHSKIISSWMFLEDHLDTHDCLYGRLRDAVLVCKEPPDKVRLRWKKTYKDDLTNILDVVDFVPRTPEEIIQEVQWKSKLDRFIETSIEENDVLEIKDLRLSDKDLHDIVNVVMSVEGFYPAILNNKHIKIVHNMAMSLSWKATD